MISGLKSEPVFKMAARVSSTSSEEMASSSEDSASEDPINIAKRRGAHLKEPEKAEIARTCKDLLSSVVETDFFELIKATFS